MANLLLSGIMPGPKEQDPDQVQRFMRIFVNELIRLWETGFVMATPKYPEGRLIRVVLVCVICDKPAAHKVGGFGSHSHTFFCTKCWIKQSDKRTPAAYQKDGALYTSATISMPIFLQSFISISFLPPYPCPANSVCTRICTVHLAVRSRRLRQEVCLTLV